MDMWSYGAAAAVTRRVQPQAEHIEAGLRRLAWRGRRQREYITQSASVAVLQCR